tara:strand:+ start:5096 stop:5833 length:738 start_codon:yes stop_codon:yes gene_type:complete
MKFRFFIVLFVFYSCTTNTTKIENKPAYNIKGFAYIFNDIDYKNKTIKGKLDNTKLQISISGLKVNTLVKIINIKTKDSITIKNSKKIDYPDFYKVLITQAVADKINVNKENLLVEIVELKKNKSFIAKKAKIFNEEKKISSNAPVTSVTISNISKNKEQIKKQKKDNFYILIASFYSTETAKFLKERIIKEIPSYDIKKLKIRKKSNKESNLISGPYKTINLMKNDYIQLKKFGFEELNFITNE